MPGLRDEIREQPEALRRTIQSVTASLPAVRPYAADLKQGRQVIITGMGGSFSAGTLGQFGLMESGVQALSIESSELIYHQAVLEPKPLIVMISQSGRSVEIARLLGDLKSRCPIIGITNGLENPLAAQSTHSLIIQAGEEKTVSSKTYTCTLAALVLLTSALTDRAEQDAIRSLEQAAQAIETALPEWEAHAKQIAERIRQTTFIEFLGRGVSRASALTGALITKETAKLPTEGMVSGQFRHGPIEVLDSNITVVILMGSGAERRLNETLADDIEARGAQVIRIGIDIKGDLGFNLPPLDDFVLPMAEIVPVQLLAAELAAQRGFPIGEFRYIAKITTTE